MMHSSIVSRLLLASLPLTAIAAPAVDPQIFDNSTHSLITRQDDSPIYMYMDTNCAAWYDKIENGLSEAVLLASPLWLDWYKNGGYQHSAARYFGIPATDDRPLSSESAKIVMANLARAAGISHVSKDPPEDMMLPNSIRISCKDEHGTCAKWEKEEKLPFAEARNDADELGRPKYSIILCKKMFEQTESLDEIWEDIQAKDEKRDQNMKNMVKSTGGGFLHELMHIDLISGPRGHMKDETDPENASVRLYGPGTIEAVSRRKNSEEYLIKNPDSYKQFAMEVYWTKQLKFRPAVRRNDFPALKCAEDEGMPFNFVGRNKISDKRDEFCTEFADHYMDGENPRNSGLWEKVLYQGTAIETKISISWESWARFSHSGAKGDCKTKILELLDSCNTDTNHKRGGENDWMKMSGIQYKLDPVASRPDPGNVPAADCDVWSHTLANKFRLKGAGFASGDYGQDLLLPALRKCSVITDWQFDYEFHEYEGRWYEWKASGDTVIGARIWGCVKNAMIAAGAPSDLVCGGH